jgi:hypothetical protein
MHASLDEERKSYVPFTPAGTPLLSLEAESIDRAWANLLEDAKHMPYKTRENFEKRGYTVKEMHQVSLSLRGKLADTEFTPEDVRLLQSIILEDVIVVRNMITENEKNPDFNHEKAEQYLAHVAVVLGKILLQHAEAIKRAGNSEDAEDDVQDPVKH